MYDAVLRAVNEVVRMRDSKVAKARYSNDDDNNNNHSNNNGDNNNGNNGNNSRRSRGRGKSNNGGNNNGSGSGNGGKKTSKDKNGAEENDEAEWKTIKSTNQKDSSNDNNNDDLLPKSASRLTQITFNTYSILIPIVHKALNHPHRANYQLKMNGPRIRKKESSIHNRKRVKIPENIMDVAAIATESKLPKRSQCYLFFDDVYSITTIKALEQLRREVDRLLDCFPGDVDSMQPHLLWGTCQSSHEIMNKTFIFNHDKSLDNNDNDNNDNGNNDNEKESDVDVDMNTVSSETIDKFSKSIDAEIIQPLMDRNIETMTMNSEVIHNLNSELSYVLNSRFRGVNLAVYGSCLSGLSLGGSSDVDISLFMPNIYTLKQDLDSGKLVLREYEKRMKKFVYRVRDAVAERGRGKFLNVTAVPFARVPVVKGTCRLGTDSQNAFINFDICFLNDIAVANSKLLREYSQLDPRARMLMLSVKSWVKWKAIGSAAENTLSSYSWMILVIFYLQCIEFVPVLQCPQFMAQHQEYHNENNRWHTVNNLRTHFVTASKVEEVGIWKVPDQFSNTSVSALLAGFFVFYARLFPKHTTAVSIRLGRCVLQKSVFKSARLWRLCIEDPFETHDVYCPHDLGTPMTEDGQAKVSKALTDAADQMEHMFSQCTEIQDCIGSFHQNGERNNATEQNERVQNNNRHKNRRQHNNRGRGHHRNDGFDRNHTRRKDQKAPVENRPHPERRPRPNKSTRKEPKPATGKYQEPYDLQKKLGEELTSRRNEAKQSNEVIDDKNHKKAIDPDVKKNNGNRRRRRPRPKKSNENAIQKN
jgi:DNA polymerase sigma